MSSCDLYSNLVGTDSFVVENKDRFYNGKMLKVTFCNPDNKMSVNTLYSVTPLGQRALTQRPYFRIH